MTGTARSSVPDDYQLTGAGWPRPLVPEGNRNVGLPVPWVAPVQALSQVNEGRAMATASAGPSPRWAQ